MMHEVIRSRDPCPQLNSGKGVALYSASWRLQEFLPSVPLITFIDLTRQLYSHYEYSIPKHLQDTSILPYQMPDSKNHG